MVAGFILAASLSSCNLAEELKAAQIAGEPLHATSTSVKDEVTSGSGRIVHLTFSGIEDNENTDGQAQASTAAAIFFVNMKKTASFNAIEVTLEKTVAEDSKGVYSSSTSTTSTYTFPGREVKRACELYETVVKSFNRNMGNTEKLKALSDPTYLADSAIHILQQTIAVIESAHGKGITTRFRGFAKDTDSSGRPLMAIKCDNLNAKKEAISYCRFFFFEHSNKVAGVRIRDYTSDLQTDKVRPVEEQK